MNLLLDRRPTAIFECHGHLDTSATALTIKATVVHVYGAWTMYAKQVFVTNVIGSAAWGRGGQL